MSMVFAAVLSVMAVAVLAFFVGRRAPSGSSPAIDTPLAELGGPLGDAPGDRDSSPEVVMDQIVRAFAKNALVLEPSSDAMAEHVDRMAAVLRYYRFGTRRIGKLDFTIEEFSKGIQAVAERLKKTSIPGLPITFDASKLNLQTMQALQSVAFGFSKEVSPKADLILAIEAGVGSVNPLAVAAWLGVKHLALPRVKTGLSVYVVGKVLTWFYGGLEEEADVPAAIVDRNCHAERIWQLTFAGDLLLSAGKDNKWVGRRLQLERGRLVAPRALHVAEDNDINCVRMSRESGLVLWGNDEGEVCLGRVARSGTGLDGIRRVKLRGWIMDVAPQWSQGAALTVNDDGVLQAIEWSESGAAGAKGSAITLEGAGYSRPHLAATPDGHVCAVWDPASPKITVVECGQDGARGVPKVLETYSVESKPLAVKVDAYRTLHVIAEDGHRYVYGPGGQRLERAAVGVDKPKAAAFHASYDNVFAVTAVLPVGPVAYVLAGSSFPVFGCMLPADLGEISALEFSDGEQLAVGTLAGETVVFQLGRLREKAAAARAPILAR